jgi:hypothetical protein
MEVGNSGVNPKISTDTAYAKNDITEPCMTDAQWAIFAAAHDAATVRAARARESLKRKARMVVEVNFNTLVQKFPRARAKEYKRYFAAGKCRDIEMCEELTLQALFTNFWSCLRGSQVSGLFGIEPPTLAEYVRSVHDGTMPDLSAIDEEE